MSVAYPAVENAVALTISLSAPFVGPIGASSIFSFVSSSRLDDKGRLKLPSEFQHFLNLLAEKKLFVTSLDRRIAQIYPMPAWRENEKFFETYRDNPQVAQDVAFNANDLGADADMDS